MDYMKLFIFIFLLLFVIGMSSLIVLYTIENSKFEKHDSDYEIKVRTRKQIGMLLEANSIFLRDSKEASELIRIIGWHMTNSEYGLYDFNQVVKEWRNNVK